jgi:hypothetical protein
MASDTDCGCCAGIEIDTPGAKFNRPGGPALVYRVGAYPDFRQTLLARLSSTDYPALAPLTTRSDGDYTIALCDSFAVLADVLTFYQERIANESYLGTAVERRSVLMLARLIGYQLTPGVAAGTALAFTLESAPGAPALAAQPVTVPVGTRAQSIPDPNQDPQTFETAAPIMARVEWNAIPAQSSEPMKFIAGQSELYLAGTSTQLSPGDAIAIIGVEREKGASSKRWDVRWIERVDVDLARDLTHISLSDGLGSQWSPSSQGVHIYAFRQRAALFGYNAPDPNLIYNASNAAVFGSVAPPDTVWPYFVLPTSGKYIDLDASYPKIVKGGWFALAGGDDPSGSSTGFVALYRVADVAQTSRTGYGVSAKITRLSADTSQDLDKFEHHLRDAHVLAQSDELTLAERPLLYPLYGETLALGGLQPLIVPDQLIAVAGKRQRVAAGVNTSGILFLSDLKRRPLPGESFVMTKPPELRVTGGFQSIVPEDLESLDNPEVIILWHVEDHDGTAIDIEARAGQLLLQSALKDDGVVSEVCAVAHGASSVQSDHARTTLTLHAPLANCYDRSTVTINANVAPATHGETVGEIAGSGSAATSNQSFQLKQSPLTYVSSTDPSGRASTLHVRVNDLLWREVPSLYGHDRREHAYTIRMDDEGKSTVQFGDGRQGARLPSGTNNVRLAYRKGIGSGGNLRAGQISMLLTRPLGVKSAVNPAPATGGQDSEALADARSNAPLHVLTLERAVSIQDYVDFARTFSGIAKAYGVWIDDGLSRGIYLTVAGPHGADIPPNSDTLGNLIGALRRYGDRLLPLSVQSYGHMTFRLRAKVKVAADADPEKVFAAVESALRAAYAFEARDFGQPVTIDELYATIQNVTGVVAADIDQLYRGDAEPVPSEPQPRLLANLPVVQAGSATPAELLTLDPAPLDFGVMS